MKICLCICVYVCVFMCVCVHELVLVGAWNGHFSILNSYFNYLFWIAMFSTFIKLQYIFTGFWFVFMSLSGIDESFGVSDVF